MATKPSPAASRGQDADRGRDLKALERRRLKAARLFAHGTCQAKVARALGVSPQTASRWHARWQQGGTRALCAPARQGRPPKLTPLQLRQLERALLKGARGHGFDEELWTLRRVAEVIWRLAGVRYHPGHVWRILRGLGWSVQRPVRVAAERDEQAIARWVAEDWPAIKQTPTRAKPGCASWTSPRFADPASPPHLGATRGDPGAG
jgi:transposase